MDAARRAHIFRETEAGGSTIRALNRAPRRLVRGARPRKPRPPTRTDRVTDEILRRTAPAREAASSAWRDFGRATEYGRTIGLPTALYLREPILEGNFEEMDRRRRERGQRHLLERIFGSGE